MRWILNQVTYQLTAADKTTIYIRPPLWLFATSFSVLFFFVFFLSLRRFLFLFWFGNNRKYSLDVIVYCNDFGVFVINSRLKTHAILCLSLFSLLDKVIITTSLALNCRRWLVRRRTLKQTHTHTHTERESLEFVVALLLHCCSAPIWEVSVI